MAGRKRSEKEHHSSEETKREQRVASSGTEGSKPHNPSSRQATVEAGEAVVKQPHKPPEVDELSASKSLGIDQSAQRDKGVSIPDSPYQKRG
jgi:hypothetical protein